MTFQIDPEFRDHLPQFDYGESEGLEERVLAEGIREPLVIWSGHNIIVDGHHRYQIAQKHGLNFDVEYMDFEDREAVLTWIEENALARRNLSPDWFKYFIGRRYERTKKAQGGTGANQYNAQTDQIDTSATADRIAKDHGVAPATVKRAAKFAQEVDANPEFKQAMLENKPVAKVKKQKQIKEAQQKVESQTKEEIKLPPVVHHEKASEFAKRFDEQSVDLLLTDPPYMTDLDDVRSFAGAWLPTYLGLVKPSGFAFVFIGAYPEELHAYLSIEAPQHIALTQVLVWTYRNTLGVTPKQKYKQNWQSILFYRGLDAPDLDSPVTNEQWAVQDVPAPDGRQGNRYHEWQKPMELVERLIRHTTKPDYTVIDPFVCTGTTVLAASKLGRAGVGADMNEQHLSIAVERGCRRV